MDAFVVIAVSLAAVAFLVYMLLKKNDIKITLLSTGLILTYIALLMGKTLKVSAPTGMKWLDPFQGVADQFTTMLVGAGFVILILGGYSGYMNHIGANRATVNLLTKPIKNVKSVYFLIPIVFLLGNLLSLVVPSASNLAIILLATLYPVLRAAGMTRMTAAAIIATSATIIPTPLGSDNVAVAAQLKMSVTDYVFTKHAIVSIPTLLAIAVVHYFWQRHLDKKAGEDLSYDQELQEYSSEKEETEEVVDKKGFVGFVYAMLPLLPIFLLLIVFFMNIVMGTKYNVSVPVVSLTSFAIAVFVEMLHRRQVQAVLKETNAFFDGMASVMDVVALTVTASVFVSGLTSLGVIDLIQKAMSTMNGSGIILPVIMVLFTAVIVLLSGSGTSLLFAMIPLMVPLANAAGISPAALSVPMGLSGNLLRAVSPVAAVVLIVAGSTHLSPIQIVKRTSVPMIFGTVMMLVLSLLLLN